MKDYIHHVPGRLRVKSTCIKRNEKEAARLQHLLSNVRGVLSHRIKTLTGSIVIYYDSTLTQAQIILAMLVQHGFLNVGATLERSRETLSQVGSSMGNALGKVIFGLAVEKVVERSAVALVKAIF